MALSNQYNGGSSTHTSSSGSTHGGSGGTVGQSSAKSLMSFFDKYGTTVTQNYHQERLSEMGLKGEPFSLQSLSIPGVGSSAKSSTQASSSYSAGSGSIYVPSSGSGVSSSGVDGDWYSLLQSINETNNAFNKEQVDAVNAFNAAEAQKNRDWQEEMSNTAHQREVKDLIAAGLNPVLSAGGQGAVTGSGAVASGQKAVADNTMSQGIIQMMQSMMAAASAENVAKIYAGATMYSANTSAATQRAYQNILKSNNTINNVTGLAKAGIYMLGRALM